MPNVSFSLPNPVGQKEAAARLKNYLARLKEVHKDKFGDLKEEWPTESQMTFSFSTYGFKISGDCTSEPDVVKLNLALPFAAMMFKSKIEQTVREEVERVLGNRPVA